jgi:hypothetical protein
MIKFNVFDLHYGLLLHMSVLKFIASDHIQ